VTKTLAELQALCDQHGIVVPPQRRAAKEPYLLALRDHFWAKEHPGQPLPEQIEPMLLGDWNDLDEEEAAAIERDDSGYCVQEKLDGVRALLHVTEDGVRITGRTISEVTFRLSEFAANVPHLAVGFENLVGTVLDGELVCPKAAIDTGDTVTNHPLQAAVAILATTPENAARIQDEQECKLRFVAFDLLRVKGIDKTAVPLRERLFFLESAFLLGDNPHLDLVETHTQDKALFRELVLAEGKEGTVYKRLDQAYEPGRRVRHWLKRKKAVEVEAIVTGFRPGTKGKGHEHLIGAVEFSTVDADGGTKPIAWVSNWTDEDRERMTRRDGDTVTLDPTMLGKRALVAGHDIAGRSGRYHHARIIKWLDAA
jgi:ATP-dependent DNA ligase